MKCYLVDRHPFTGYSMFSFLRARGVKVIDRGHWRPWRPGQRHKEWSGLPTFYNADAYAQWADKVAEEEKRHKPDFYACAEPHFFTLFEKSAAPTICNMMHRLYSDYRDAEQFDILIEKAVAGVESGKLRMYSASYYDIDFFKYFTGKDASYFPASADYLRGGGTAGGWKTPSAPIFCYLAAA